MEKYRPAIQITAVPLLMNRVPRSNLLTSPAPLEFLPPVTKLSFQQKGEAVIEMRLRQIWFEIEGLAIADCSRSQLALLAKGEPEGV